MIIRFFGFISKGQVKLPVLGTTLTCQRKVHPNCSAENRTELELLLCVLMQFAFLYGNLLALTKTLIYMLLQTESFFSL